MGGILHLPSFFFLEIFRPGVVQSELAGKDLRVFRGDRHVGNPVLSQNQFSCPSSGTVKI